jgi:hypothetical protein
VNDVTLFKSYVILYTIYAPPHHRDGLINTAKNDAEKNDVEFDGKTTE